MKRKVIFLIFILLSFIFGNFVLAKNQKPKISLSFPKSFFANEEIEVLVSVSNLNNLPYDLKIAIQKEKKVLSEIYNEKERKWQSSLYYLKEMFSGPSFERKFKLRLKKEFSLYEGEAEVVVRIRESGKSNFSEVKTKIEILKPEIKKELPTVLNQPSEEKNHFTFPFLIASFTSLISATFILFFKKKIKFFKKL